MSATFSVSQALSLSDALCVSRQSMPFYLERCADEFDELWITAHSGIDRENDGYRRYIARCLNQSTQKYLLAKKIGSSFSTLRTMYADYNGGLVKLSDLRKQVREVSGLLDSFK